MGDLKIAVTGASGFIGRHVLRALDGRGIDIVAVTRNAGRLAAAGVPLRVVEMDIGRADDSTFDRLGRPDTLIHLAWDGLPNYRSPHHLEIELPRQQAFLESMLEAGLSSLLVTGTCFEYGLQSGCLAEDMEPRPDNPYARAKDASRRALEARKERRPFALTWARLFYMYGDGQAASSLYSTLSAAVARGDRVFDMSGGEQLRDFLPVEEVADSVVRLAMRRSDFGCVNVCSGRPVSVRAQVEAWLEQNGWSIELNLGHYPYPDYEPMEFWGDRGKLDRLLGGDR